MAWSEATCEPGWGDSLSPATVFHWFDFRIPRTMQFFINPFEHSREVTGDLGIPEADDTISLMLKPKLPLTITLSRLVVVVVSAVKFDDETCGGAEEINNIRTDRSLPPKMRAIDRQFFQGTPQSALVWRRVGA